MTKLSRTEYLNDSCDPEELLYAIERGCVGATSNPVIVFNVLQKHLAAWTPRIQAVVREHPDWDETRVAWAVYETIALEAAKLLLPIFEATGGKKGRLSIQVDPAAYTDGPAIAAQARHFAGLAPNIQVKIPATAAGIAQIEELTFEGIHLNVTVSFAVAQVVAIAEAVERGLARRTAAGLSVETMSPYATLMVGRVDDWLKIQKKKLGLQDVPDAALEWGGVACFKNAYRIYTERKYRTVLLAAAYRNMEHWTEFVGGDVAMTIPWGHQVRYNHSGIAPSHRMDVPVDPAIVAALQQCPDFEKAFNPDALTIDEFQTFPMAVRTLRTFVESWHNLVGLIRDVMLPNPDL